MKFGKAIVFCTIFCGALALGGCASTLFFPAKAAEKAVDKVIDDVWLGMGQPAPLNAEAKKP